MKAIVAEKPSVARDIAKVLGVKNLKDGCMENDNYIITWCIGHLVTLSYPTEYDEKYNKWVLDDLPIIPEKMMYAVTTTGAKQFNIVKKILNSDNVDSVICATDAGREGEYIFGLVYNMSKCVKPVERLWISSMTDESIKKGFENLRSGNEFKNLYESASCRAIADWLIGINASRKFSLEYSAKLTLGRVQTPTLAMIVNRQRDIDNFVSEPFYEIVANYQNGFMGKWVNDLNESKIKQISDADEIINKIKDKLGLVHEIQKKLKKKNNPLLYDLTELQRECNRRFGFTAQKTLDIAQRLYEVHKVTTYPRTDSRYLSSDLKNELNNLLNIVQKNYYNAEIDEILKNELKTSMIDDNKISDHHAIIVTNKAADLKALNEDEQRVYKLICTRFVAAFMPVHEYEETTITVKIESEKFISKGIVIVVNGWCSIEKPDKNEDDEKNVIPALSEGENLDISEIKRLDKKTSAKSPYTEATLLSAMENAGQFVENEELKEQLKSRGIGTPATRAEIIEKLVKENYILRKGKNVFPTEKGTLLVQVAPIELTSPELTGVWEQNLNLIAKGESSSNDFLNGIKELTRTITDMRIEANKALFKSEEKEKNDNKEVIGICPRCGKNIYESEKSFYCEGFKDDPKCGFSMWKEDKFFISKGKKLTKAMAVKLLKGQGVKMTKLKSAKTEKEYDATIFLKDTGTYVNYDMKFE